MGDLLHNGRGGIMGGRHNGRGHKWEMTKFSMLKNNKFNAVFLSTKAIKRFQCWGLRFDLFKDLCKIYFLLIENFLPFFEIFIFEKRQGES